MKSRMKKNIGLLSAAAVAAFTFAGNASAVDYKGISGAACDSYGGTSTNTYKSSGGYIYTTMSTGGYTNIFCPIVRENMTSAIRDVWVDFKNDTGTQYCYLRSSDRSGTSYVMDTEKKTVSAGYNGTLRFTASSLTNYSYGAYTVQCTMNSGDRLYNVYWGEN